MAARLGTRVRAWRTLSLCAALLLALAGAAEDGAPAPAPTPASTPTPAAAPAPVPAAEPAAARTPRVLACFWGLDRATDVTFASFQQHVLDVLNADLCAAVPKQLRDGDGEWHAAAKWLDVYEEPSSYANFTSARATQLAANTSQPHLLRENFLVPTGVQQLYSKLRVWRLLQRHKLLERYDWVLLCRTDLAWLAPIYDFRHDVMQSLWIPNAGAKSDWYGYYDRAVAVPAAHVKVVLMQVEAVRNGSHPFLNTLRGFPGTNGTSTSCEAFYRQYLEYYQLPVQRFPATAFVTATSASLAKLRFAQRNNDTGHTYKYTDEYVTALNNALAHYRSAEAAVADAASRMLPAPTAHDAGTHHDTRGRRFYVVTIDQAERANRTLKNCALSAWGMAVYERLLSHPLRTKHVAEAYAAFAPPHFAWDLHWPVPNGARRGNAARPDRHFPLPEEGAGYEPYGSSLATSCRTFFAPCGYEGCVPAFGAARLRQMLVDGSALSPEGVLAVLEKLYRRMNLVPDRQVLVFYDSGAAGPVAYHNDTQGGYDLPERAYRDSRFVFALATSLHSRFRPGVDVSLPTPWTEDVRRYVVRSGLSRTYFLTFKGDFGTSRAAGDVRRRARAALHDPDAGVIIVDSKSVEGYRYDYTRLMYDTVFALILRGDQPYSYRYTEVVCSGAVPVMVMSDGWVPPFNSLHNFSEYGVLVQDEALPGLVDTLRAMSDEEVEQLRYAAKQFCMQHLITPHQQTDSMIEAVLGAPDR